ncbi:MAG: phosphodiester glycosidase family protein [Candidatus Peribacteria bacterium]|nr:phosphodiester glycosidase family protein [Candidatus Peribacteria bacterium]
MDLKSLPDILLKVGCFNALNLDAGASSAMIYNGRYII